MADSLLSHRISTLLLNAKAPFPSEVTDAHDFIRKRRMSQRLRLLERPDDSVRGRDSDDPGNDPDMGEP
jgi:hypothetical protein